MAINPRINHEDLLCTADRTPWRHRCSGYWSVLAAKGERLQPRPLRHSALNDNAVRGSSAGVQRKTLL
jgi:hypothetical protein